MTIKLGIVMAYVEQDLGDVSPPRVMSSSNPKQTETPMTRKYHGRDLKGRRSVSTNFSAAALINLIQKGKLKRDSFENRCYKHFELIASWQLNDAD